MSQPDRAVLEPVLAGLHPASTIEFLTVMVGSADFEWWAERYLAQEFGYDRILKQFEHPPKGVDLNAATAYDLDPDGRINILMMNSNGASTIVTFRPDVQLMKSYVHICYRYVQQFDDGQVIVQRPSNPGEVSTVSVLLEILDRAGETQETTVRTVVDVADGTATITTSSTTVLKSRPQYFIYQLGKGSYPAIDAWSSSAILTSPYFPSIPIRVDNVDWTAESKRDTPLFKTSKKLVKKLGIDLLDVAKNVNDTKDIKEIDYCFLTLGVALKTPAQEGKRYLYRYFQYLRSISTAVKQDFTDWKTDYDRSTGVNQPMGGGGMTMRGMGSKGLIPDIASGFITPSVNSIEIYSDKDRKNNHDITLSWNYIDTTLHAGEAFAGAKVGDVDLFMAGAQKLYHLGTQIAVDNSTLTARRQVTENSYEELEIGGLQYENFIYNGKSVIIHAYDAFTDVDQDGFIVPLNQAIVRATPLVELTDLGFQCCHLVFNCYQIVKQKWYQTGWFKILLIIIAIIITVWTMGADGGQSLAYAMAFNTAVALGATGILLTYLAATIYVLALTVLSSIIMKQSTKIFGEKWGALIGMVVMLFVGSYGNYSMEGGVYVAGASGTQMGSILTANNFINISSKVVDVVLNDKMAKLNKKLTGLKTDFDTEMEKIENLTKEHLGTNADLIDIFGYVDSTQLNYEAMDTFLTRTLLTGSDICEITLDMVTNFSEIGLELPNTG
ncbi:hypothetical protein [Pseudomonas sp.]